MTQFQSIAFGGGPVTITRPNDTSSYAANDVIGAATNATAAVLLGTTSSANQAIMFTTTTLEIDITSVVSGMTSFFLQLYSAPPPSALGDNGAWTLATVDRTSYLGSINLGTPVLPVTSGNTLYVQTAQINSQILLPTKTLYGYLMTVGAWQPAASTVFVVNVSGVTP